MVHVFCLVILHPPNEAIRVFQARALGADDRTLGLLLLAPVSEVKGEILEYASSFPQNAAYSPQD